MKLILSLTLLLSFLFIPSAALANIPGIQQTSQYKSLNSYVTFLESQSAIPVSETQKATYQSTLNQRAANARAKVQSLRTQRRNKKINTYKRNLKKAIQKINRARSSNLANAKSWYNLQVNNDRINYQAALQLVYNKYDPKINSVNQKIKKVKQKIKKAEDPVTVEILETQLDALISQKDSLLNFRSAAKKKAANDYQDAIKKDLASYKSRVKRINKRADNNINQQKQTRQSNLDQSLTQIDNKRIQETSLVETLTSSGQAAINAMPLAT